MESDANIIASLCFYNQLIAILARILVHEC
jgi:hypothetical protein